MAVTDIELDVELLKKEVSDMKQIHGRLDTAITKITDVSNCINRMLAVHEEKISQQEEVQIRQASEFSNDVKELHSRITTSTKEMTELMTKQHYEADAEMRRLRMDITERLQFDIAMNFGMGMGDIDMSKVNEENADGYKSLNFGIYYDLFTPGKNVADDYVDDSYYADVDFAKLEAEDEDGDLVPDIDDYCPQTPIGVKVDRNGCPLDDDKDGIANYLDKQDNTPESSIVDENGVRLTADKYQSMYSDFEVASRKYANFYNEVEIKREDYKTVDEYLVAKANAFNKAFNESLNDDSKVRELIYKVKIGEFKDGIPAKMANKLLSLDDLESFTMDDDVVIYVIGSYNTSAWDHSWISSENCRQSSNYSFLILFVDIL